MNSDRALTRFLQVAGLCAFAIAQPLFDTLARYPTFFAAHRTGSFGVIAFAILAVLAPAGALFGIEALIGAISKRAGRVAHLVLIGLLVGLAVASAIDRSHDIGTKLWGLALIGSGVLAAFLYDRFVVTRRLLVWLAIAPVAFVVLFLTNVSIRAFLVGPPEVPIAQINRPAPVVMLVFDGLSLPALFGPDGEIDVSRYPNFAKLASTSTWYRDATTSANRTQVAVPALTAGVLPNTGRRPPPVASVYPRNLFSLFRDRKLNVEETVTYLCSTCSGRAAPSGWRHLASDSVIVSLHTLLPQRFAEHALPEINFKWAAFLGDHRRIEGRIANTPWPFRPVMRLLLRPMAYRSPAEVDRYRSFLKAIGPERDAIHYLHLNLPHDPFEYLPTLQRYPGEGIPGRREEMWRDDESLLDYGMQRYVMQLQAADQVLAGVRTKLEGEQVWDDAIVVVAADHGFAFYPNYSSRMDDGPNVPQVLRIPLFIKRPQQRAGVVDTELAESIDTLPTILSLLGGDPTGYAGSSLLSGARRPSRRVHSDLGFQNYPREIGPGTRTFDRIERLFDGSDTPYAFGPHRALLGTSPTTTATFDGGRLALMTRMPSNVDPIGEELPARVAGSFEKDAPEWVAIALNGKIAGFGRPFTFEGRTYFDAVISHEYFIPGRNALAFYAIGADSTLSEIRLR